MIYFEIDEQYNSSVDVSHLRYAAESTLKHQQIIDADLTIAIENSPRLQELNLQYLGIDAPTDVLAFSGNEVDPETNRHYLGDVIISFPIAEAQANLSGHPVIAELQLLVVHGTLHLAGHDHSSAEEKNAMWAAQREILNALKCPLAKYPD